MDLLLYMDPIDDVFLLPTTLITEENVIGITLAQDDIKISWYLLFNSVQAYFVNLTNILVMKHTNISHLFPLSFVLKWSCAKSFIDQKSQKRMNVLSNALRTSGQKPQERMNVLSNALRKSV
ncbi:hypothetical protein F3Y22_tig00110156pilonHSYRG00267 [Hibiscus syriacus]|uniref:Uncharacterized protein n=1 Tax=Hibiscus syriacus TaxID=106335 RepID=A0A6A3BLW8_HIBSY|nr:hypothetical protein F3Y22_tig00110156pilonHSYRG00267 [Hibiscus syriacus]